MVVYLTTNLVNNKKYIGKDVKNNPNYLGSGALLLEDIKKYGKQKFYNINQDIFKLTKYLKKFDIVISNGVAHHTKDPKKNIKRLHGNGFGLFIYERKNKLTKNERLLISLIKVLLNYL